VGFTQASELLLPATLVFAVAAVVRLANLWLNGRLADQRRVAVGSDLSFIS
jgi:ATP-binding cassette, subfamily B, bacterial PglK